MATQGTAARSASGASMSKYDVEVEGRLKKLEAAVKDLKSELSEVKNEESGGGEGVEEKLNLLISILKKTETLGIERISKGRL